MTTTKEFGVYLKQNYLYSINKKSNTVTYIGHNGQIGFLKLREDVNGFARILPLIDSNIAILGMMSKLQSGSEYSYCGKEEAITLISSISYFNSEKYTQN